MRLGSLLLTAAVLAAQTPVRKSLPWERLPDLPWQLSQISTPPDLPPPSPVPSDKILTVHIAEDGAIRICDSKGRRLLRAGLPGRPRKLWANGGHPLDPAKAPFIFPSTSGLDGGLGSLPFGKVDFRPAMDGLLWILDDSERMITLINPSRSQVVYIPLPEGRNLNLFFHRDHLEVQEGADPAGSRRERSCWILPWMALLSQFLHLNTPPPSLGPGTALDPFPQE